MVLGGIALLLGSIAVGMGPIAFVSGILLLWSGIVKFIVLRIWRATLSPHAPTTTADVNAGKNAALEHRL